MRLPHEIAIFQTVKSKVIISLIETVRLSVSISLRNLYNSLNSIKEMTFPIKILFKPTMLYLTCTMISSVDLAHYGVSRAKDRISIC